MTTKIESDISIHNLKQQNKKKRYIMDEHYIRPAVAERKMRIAAGINQTIWCMGVCGVGKTSFVLDYFKRRRYDYYSAKEIIPTQVTMPKESDNTKIIIIDDLYGITESDFRAGWTEIIEEFVRRNDIWLILISRSNVPCWLDVISIQNMFYQIEESDLLLSRNQMDSYFAGWNIELEENSASEIWKLGEGHPLWMRICAIELLKEQDKHKAIIDAQERIWKYLNTYVYDQWDSEIGEVLMKLSVIESFDWETAVYITGNNNVNVLLQQAIELGNFMERTDGVWQMRLPMRQSMNQRLRQYYGVDYIAALYSRAGDAMRIKGEMVKALHFYEKAKDKRNIAELLIQNARENPSSGHYYEMKHYYMNLPEEYIKQSVELMAAMSMLQSMLMNEEESERWYNEIVRYSKIQSGSRKKEAENKLLYLDIALPHRGTVELISIMKNAGNLLFNRKAKLPEFSVTSNLPSMMNGGKDFSEWSKRDKELASSIGKIISLVLGRYGRGFVNLALAESSFEKGKDNYDVERLAIQGRMEAESGGKIEQCFVATGVLAWLAIMTGHMDHAIITMNGFYERAKKENAATQLFMNYDAMYCRMALYMGRTAEISKWMKNAPMEKKEFYTMDRFRYLTKARVYLSDARYEEAKLLLQQLSFYAEKNQRIYIAMESNLLKAILYYRMNNEKWINILQEVISHAEEYHFVRLLSREGAALMPLLRKGTFTWKNTEFHKEVEKETLFMADTYPAYLKTSTENVNLILPENALKILRMQSMGSSTAQIAEKLEISTATVKYHNKQTYKKLGVKTKAQAVNEAKNRKLI